jgi:hypothetical protein
MVQVYQLLLILKRGRKDVFQISQVVIVHDEVTTKVGRESIHELCSDHRPEMSRQLLSLVSFLIIAYQSFLVVLESFGPLSPYCIECSSLTG